MKIEYNWPLEWSEEAKKQASEYMDRVIDSGLLKMYGKYHKDHDLISELDKIEKEKVIHMYEEPHE